MSRGDWYEPKHQLTIIRERVAGDGKRKRPHTRGESHNWKMRKWMTGLVITLIHFVVVVTGNQTQGLELARQAHCAAELHPRSPQFTFVIVSVRKSLRVIIK